jgi:hypothetical protein
MIADPEARGRALAGLYRDVAPRLFVEIEDSGLLEGDADARRRARTEWECFALYACVRGLVAAGGFNRETARAIEAFHEELLADGPDAARRALVSERYAEYGAIGQAGGAAGAATVTRRLGEAAARRMAGTEGSGLADLAGTLHESLVEGATEAVRTAADR